LLRENQDGVRHAVFLATVRYVANVLAVCNPAQLLDLTLSPDDCFTQARRCSATVQPSCQWCHHCCRCAGLVRVHCRKPSLACVCRLSCIVVLVKRFVDALFFSLPCVMQADLRGEFTLLIRSLCATGVATSSTGQKVQFAEDRLLRYKPTSPGMRWLGMSGETQSCFIQCIERVLTVSMHSSCGPF